MGRHNNTNNINKKTIEKNNTGPEYAGCFSIDNSFSNKNDSSIGNFIEPEKYNPTIDKIVQTGLKPDDENSPKRTKTNYIDNSINNSKSNLVQNDSGFSPKWTTNNTINNNINKTSLNNTIEQINTGTENTGCFSIDNSFSNKNDSSTGNLIEPEKDNLTKKDNPTGNLIEPEKDNPTGKDNLTKPVIEPVSGPDKKIGETYITPHYTFGEKESIYLKSLDMTNEIDYIENIREYPTRTIISDLNEILGNRWYDLYSQIGVENYIKSKNYFIGKEKDEFKRIVEYELREYDKRNRNDGVDTNQIIIDKLKNINNVDETTQIQSKNNIGNINDDNILKENKNNPETIENSSKNDKEEYELDNNINSINDLDEVNVITETKTSDLYCWDDYKIYSTIHID